VILGESGDVLAIIVCEPFTSGHESQQAPTTTLRDIRATFAKHSLAFASLPLVLGIPADAYGVGKIPNIFFAI
jgi:hypothetical protein